MSDEKSTRVFVLLYRCSGSPSHLVGLPQIDITNRWNHESGYQLSEHCPMCQCYGLYPVRL